MNISFFSLRFDLFSIIAKEVNQIRNNVVCVVAHLVFLFCCALTTGRCNAFQHNSVNVMTMLFLVTMVKYGICSSLHFEYRLWVIIFTQERALRKAFTYLKPTTETLKKSENYSKLIKTPERLSTLLILNFVHNLLFLLVSRCWIWTSKCLLCPTLSIYY